MRGRGAEFETVLSLLASTQQGQGQILLVEGEPGSGKSLLLGRPVLESQSGSLGLSLLSLLASHEPGVAIFESSGRRTKRSG